MTFEQQLQQAIEKAADEYSERGMIGDWSMRGNFVAGANLLLPLLLKAIEQRDAYIELLTNGYKAEVYSKERRNQELLKLLGEG